MIIQDMAIPSVFQYVDYRLFLADYYRAAKARNPRYSHRYIQEKVRATSAGWFSDVLSGRANLTGTYRLRLATLLNLQGAEVEYFETIVSYAQAGSLEERNRCLERILSFKELKTDVLGRDKFEYYRKWYYVAIRELLFIYPFKGDYAALARKLNPPIRPQQARQALALLRRLDMLRKDAQGYLKPTVSIVKKDTRFKSLHLANFMKANLELGIEALGRFTKEERDISSLVLVLAPGDFEKARQEIKALRKRLLALSENAAGAGKVYQCNFQMFPISR